MLFVFWILFFAQITSLFHCVTLQGGLLPQIGVLHGEEFLVVDGVVELSALQLSGLVRDRAVATFSVTLHETASEGIVGRVANDRERTLKIRQCKEWSRYEALLDAIKRGLVFRRPGPCSVFLEQGRERMHHRGVALRELVQVRRKTEPLAELLGVARDGSVCDRLDLLGVGTTAVRADKVAEDGDHLGHAKHALLQVGVQLVFAEDLEDAAQVAAVHIDG